jgi:hypothetical protein
MGTTYVIDATPKWWQRNRIIQRIRHMLGVCEGAGMVMGRECHLCFRDACAYVASKQSGGGPA